MANLFPLPFPLPSLRQPHTSSCDCSMNIRNAREELHNFVDVVHRTLITIRLDIDDDNVGRHRLATAHAAAINLLKTKIIPINLDTSSDNNSSDSGNNTLDSSSTSQISTSKEIDYNSLEYRGPPKSLLKWYGYLSDEYTDKGGNESDAKPSFLDISKAKACMLAKAQVSDASSKAKVQTYGSKAKLQRSPKTLIVKSLVPITNGVLGLANAETWDAILSKTFRNGLCFEIIVLSLNSSDDRKRPSKASIPIFEGPSVQGLLDYYGYNDIEEYLSWNYFPSTYKENTDKDIRDKDTTDKDCIHECNYAMSKGKYVPVSHKHNPKVKSHVPVTGCVLGLENVTT
ncbi:hypothetical protein Tco_1369927 [Tanacetum coccineum]